MLELFLAEFKRTWIQFIRYSVEAISAIVINILVFYGLFLSARYIAGPTLQFGDRLDAIVLGYVLWSLVIFIVNDIAIGLQIEAQTGTLEQLFMSPFGAFRVFLIRALANLTLRLVLILCVLTIIIVLTGSQLYFPTSLLLPLFTMLLGAYGLALIMGSLALVFKRIQQLLGLFQFALLFLLTVPMESWVSPLQNLRVLLPMILSANILRSLMVWNQSLDLALVASALINGAIYFVLGILAFCYAERYAKRKGVLGGY